MELHQQTPEHHSEPVNFWLKAVLVAAVLLSVLFSFTPIIMKSKKTSVMMTSTNNSKQIFLLMVEFDDDFQKFPNDETADSDQDLEGYKGEYSNDYLGQFLAGGYVQSEEIFHAKGGARIQRMPDNVYNTKETTLSEGECGFAYVKNLSTKSDSGTPILLAPMYGDGFKFNTDIYKGKAVVLRVDGSVQTLRLNKDRLAKLPNGKTLFQEGSDTVWSEEGFLAKNLHYAKYPYDFTPTIIRREWITPFNVLVLLFCIVLFIYICKKIVAARKKSVSEK